MQRFINAFTLAFTLALIIYSFWVLSDTGYLPTGLAIFFAAISLVQWVTLMFRPAEYNRPHWFQSSGSCLVLECEKCGRGRSDTLHLLASKKLTEDQVFERNASL